MVSAAQAVLVVTVAAMLRSGAMVRTMRMAMTMGWDQLLRSPL
jgi:hypothetical protein